MALESEESLPREVQADDVAVVEGLAQLLVLPEVLPDHEREVQDHLDAQNNLFVEILVHEERRVAPANALEETNGEKEARVEQQHLLRLDVVLEQ